MQEMYKLEGTVLTVVLPQDVDHPVTDQMCIRDRITTGNPIICEKCAIRLDKAKKCNYSRWEMLFLIRRKL